MWFHVDFLKNYLSWDSYSFLNLWIFIFSNNFDYYLSYYFCIISSTFQTSIMLNFPGAILLYMLQLFSSLLQSGNVLLTCVLVHLFYHVFNLLYVYLLNCLWMKGNGGRERYNQLNAEFQRISSVQFSHLVLSDSLWPHGLQHTRPCCPSPTPRDYPNSCPLSRWCHQTISSFVVPFSSCL